MSTVQRRLTAISEANRFRIVELLKHGPQPVGVIGERLDLGQPQVSRHLRILSDAGVVQATKHAQQRIYRIRPEAIGELGTWIQGFADLWSDRMDRLGSVLDDAGAEPTTTGRHQRRSASTPQSRPGQSRPGQDEAGQDGPEQDGPEQDGAGA